MTGSLCAAIELASVPGTRRELAGAAVTVDSRQKRVVVTDKGSRFNCDHVLMAGTLRAKVLMRQLSVVASPLGMKVIAKMQSIADPTLFTVGYCTGFQPRALPEPGVARDTWASFQELFPVVVALLSWRRTDRN